MIDKPGNTLHWVLLGHCEAGDGGLHQQVRVEVGGEEESGLLFKHLAQHGVETVNQIRMVREGGSLDGGQGDGTQLRQQRPQWVHHLRLPAVHDEELLGQVEGSGLGGRAVTGQGQG